jgi:hypothetical protein
VDDGIRTRDGRNHNPGLYQLSYVHHIERPTYGGAPGRNRTCNRRLRRPVLYPVELRALLNQILIAPNVLLQAAARVPQTIVGIVNYIRVSSDISTKLVGAEGFEPPTLCSQSRCATRLRHAPCRSPCDREGAGIVSGRL